MRIFRLLLSSRWRAAVAIVAFVVAGTVGFLATGTPCVVPLSFLIAGLLAWDFGWAASFGWVALIHVGIPGGLALFGTGPFHLFPAARGIVAILLVGSTIAETALVVLTLWLRALTRRLRQSEAALRGTNEELRRALDEVVELRGYLPICAWCKDIRDVAGNWEKLESYIARHSRATFTHSLCPQCMETMEAQLRRKAAEEAARS